MTEFEFIQVGDLAGNSIGSSAMDFIAVVFAFVVASHFAGKILTRFAAISISVVYSLWLTGPLLGLFSAITLGIRNSVEFYQVYPDSYAIDPPSAFPEMIYFVAMVPLLLGWLGSLLYMHAYVRKNESHNLSEGT